jgi:zinc D-Ala-D-Ala carboxypeptidase
MPRMKADLEFWRWPNFRPEEFACQHCGAHGMDEDTLDRLQQLRLWYQAPIIINSGYRCAKHPIEAAKPRVGSHAMGRAADIRATVQEQRKLRPLAVKAGFTGFGSAKSYLHVDDIQPGEHQNIRRPAAWDYS